MLDSITGYLRLSANGTNYFNNKSKEGNESYIKSFINNNLTEQLVQCIPIDNYPSRLNFSGRFDIDSNEQILLELSINAISDSSKPNVKLIMDDLNTLISNKSITCISGLIFDIDQYYKFTPRCKYF